MFSSSMAFRGVAPLRVEQTEPRHSPRVSSTAAPLKEFHGLQNVALPLVEQADPIARIPQLASTGSASRSSFHTSL